MTALSDTDPEAVEVQSRLLGQASVARRTELAFSLSATVVDLARRALQRADPAASEQEIALRFVALHYGEELAAGLRAYLARHRT